MSYHIHGWSKKELSLPKGFNRSSSEDSFKISIVIPTLNQAETIEDTLLTILNQDYKDYEIIIMDGGSTDATLELLHKYSPWITHLISGQDKGQSNAINNGFKLASGDIYAWINSDDYYMPGAFRKVVEIFTQDLNIDVVVGAGNIVSKENVLLKFIASMEMTRENLLQWDSDKWIMQQSCFWTSRIWNESGGVDESLNLLMDLDLWFRFAELGQTAALENILGVMRYYPEAKTVSQKTKVKEELGYIYAKNDALSQVRGVIRDLSHTNHSLVDGSEKREQLRAVKLIRKLGIRI